MFARRVCCVLPFLSAEKKKKTGDRNIEHSVRHATHLNIFGNRENMIFIFFSLSRKSERSRCFAPCHLCKIGGYGVFMAIASITNNVRIPHDLSRHRRDGGVIFVVYATRNGGLYGFEWYGKTPSGCRMWKYKALCARIVRCHICIRTDKNVYEEYENIYRAKWMIMAFECVTLISVCVRLYSNASIFCVSPHPFQQHWHWCHAVVQTDHDVNSIFIFSLSLSLSLQSSPLRS